MNELITEDMKVMRSLVKKVKINDYMTRCIHLDIAFLLMDEGMGIIKAKRKASILMNNRFQFDTEI